MGGLHLQSSWYHSVLSLKKTVTSSKTVTHGCPLLYLPIKNVTHGCQLFYLPIKMLHMVANSYIFKWKPLLQTAFVNRFKRQVSIYKLVIWDLCLTFPLFHEKDFLFILFISPFLSIFLCASLILSRYYSNIHSLLSCINSILWLLLLSTLLLFTYQLIYLFQLKRCGGGGFKSQNSHLEVVV